MPHSLIFGLSALTALIPLLLISRRQEPAPDRIFWSAVVVSIAGPSIWVFVQMTESWQTGLSSALWVTVMASTIIFALIAALTQNGWRLVPVFALYMIILAGLALIWQQGQAAGHDTGAMAPMPRWVQVHIIASVITYALVTVGGVSSFAAFIQEKALKTKQPTSLSRLLPSLTDCESLTVRLLAIAAATLAFGLMTGMIIQYSDSGQLLRWDHKTILSLTSFTVILALLFAHFQSGLRGRLAARFVLLAYLLMTLGYPGVKFVTDVIMG